MELKLTPEPTATPDEDRLLQSDRESLPFPRIDWVELRRAGKAAPLDDDAVARAHEVERAIEDVQRRLDEAHNELDEAYRLPSPDDWPPSAA